MCRKAKNVFKRSFEKASNNDKRLFEQSDEKRKQELKTPSNFKGKGGTKISRVWMLPFLLLLTQLRADSSHFEPIGTGKGVEKEDLSLAIMVVTILCLILNLLLTACIKVKKIKSENIKKSSKTTFESISKHDKKSESLKDQKIKSTEPVAEKKLKTTMIQCRFIGHVRYRNARQVIGQIGEKHARR